jgi:hypothetical protein
MACRVNHFSEPPHPGCEMFTCFCSYRKSRHDWQLLETWNYACREIINTLSNHSPQGVIRRANWAYAGDDLTSERKSGGSSSSLPNLSDSLYWPEKQSSRRLRDRTYTSVRHLLRFTKMRVLRFTITVKRFTVNGRFSESAQKVAHT